MLLLDFDTSPWCHAFFMLVRSSFPQFPFTCFPFMFPPWEKGFMGDQTSFSPFVTLFEAACWPPVRIGGCELVSWASRLWFTNNKILQTPLKNYLVGNLVFSFLISWSLSFTKSSCVSFLHYLVAKCLVMHAHLKTLLWGLQIQHNSLPPLATR